MEKFLEIIYYNFEKNGLFLDKEIKEWVLNSKENKQIIEKLNTCKSCPDLKISIEIAMISVLHCLKLYFYEKIIDLDIELDDDKNEIFEWINIGQAANTLLEKVVKRKIQTYTEVKEDDIGNKN